MSIFVPPGYMLLEDAAHEIGRQLFPGTYIGDQARERVAQCDKLSRGTVEWTAAKQRANPAVDHFLDACKALRQRLVGTPPDHKDAIQAMLLAERAISPNPYPLPAAFWSSGICKDAFTTNLAIYPGRIYERSWSPLAPPIEGLVIIPAASVLPSAAAAEDAATPDSHRNADLGDVAEHAPRAPRSGGKSREARRYWRPLVALFTRWERFEPQRLKLPFHELRKIVMEDAASKEWRGELPKERMLRDAFREAKTEAHANELLRQERELGRRG
jgi:hypothetical protein